MKEENTYYKADLQALARKFGTDSTFALGNTMLGEKALAALIKKGKLTPFESGYRFTPVGLVEYAVDVPPYEPDPETHRLHVQGGKGVRGKRFG